MKQYEISYTTKNGERVTNQIFTAPNITNYLLQLEKWECTDINIKSIEK